MDVFFSDLCCPVFIWFGAVRLYGAGFFEDTALLVGWPSKMFATLVEKITWPILSKNLLLLLKP